MTTTRTQYTSSTTWTAPLYLLNGVVNLDVFGAPGGYDPEIGAQPQGQGGRVMGQISVITGDVLTFTVGANGGDPTLSVLAARGGGGGAGTGHHAGGVGGDSGVMDAGMECVGGYGGGGSTAVLAGATLHIEAPGGGGAGGWAGTKNYGGAGGSSGNTPSAGSIGSDISYGSWPGNPGGPGSTDLSLNGAGGAAALGGWSGAAGSNGAAGVGGAGSLGDSGINPGGGGGGGGGGSYGGGGGSGGGSNSAGGGGGGATSFVSTAVINPVFYEGESTLYGSVTATWTVADAPLAPVLGSPITAGSVDMTPDTAPFTFTVKPGTDSGAMNAYALRMKPSAGSYGYWNGTDFSSSTPVWHPAGGVRFTVNIPKNTFTAGTSYDWSVATQESHFDLQGPFATDFTFTAGPFPTLVFTAPIEDAFSATPTISWTGTFPDGATQTHYRGIAYTEAQVDAIDFVPGVGANVHDTGAVASATPSYTSGSLPSVDKYVVYVRLTDSNGVTGNWFPVTFIVSVGGPAAPTITATPEVDLVTSAPYTLIASSDSPSSGVTMEIQCSDDGVNWEYVRGGLGLPLGGSVSDYESPFNQPRYYRARAIGNLSTAHPGAFGPWTDTVTTTLTSNRHWLVDPLNPGLDADGFPGAIPLYTTSSRTGSTASGVRLAHEIQQIEQQGQFQVFGRKSTMLVRGDMYDENFELATWFGSLVDWNNFDALRLRRVTLCMRSNIAGQLYYVAIGSSRPRDIYGGVDKLTPESISEAIVAMIPQDRP